MKRFTVPKPPASLRKVPDAVARWKVVAPQLARRGPVDVVSLETYCRVWARWQEAERRIAESGMLVRDQASGRATKNPLFAVARDAQQTIESLEARLGLADNPEADGDTTHSDADLVTRRDLAAEYKVHMQTVTKWERDGLPIARRGRRGKPSLYSRAAVRRWHQSREDTAADTGALEVNRERARKERAQAQLAEQMHAVRAGRLIDAEEAEKRWAAEIVAARAVILGTYTTAADRVLQAAVTGGLPAVERELKVLAYEILRELAQAPGASAEQVPA